MKALFIILGLGVGVYLALCVGLYFGQRSLLYFPKPEATSALAEAMWLDTAGARLKIWALKRPGDEALIYFGGNAESVEVNIETFHDWFPNHSVYIANYRGSGGSAGKPTEADLCADAIALYDHLSDSHQQISVIGRSLGSGVASCLASERRVTKLALITPFDSILSIAKNIYSWLPVELILKDKFDSSARAARIAADVLVVVASDDRVVPAAHGRALAAAFGPQQVIVREINGANHINVSEFLDYQQALREFL
jgi:pimeloyl-ACP methyl ester carboxylesterase